MDEIEAQAIVDYWNEHVAPYIRAQRVNKLGRSLKRAINEVLENEMDVGEFIDALGSLIHLRGFTEQGRVSLRRLCDEHPKGGAMIVRIFDGEYDSWTEPTPTDDEPTLREIIDEGHTPTDWLRPPLGSSMGVSIEDSVLYCQRLVSEAPYIPSWLLRVYPDASQDHFFWKRMNGLIDPLLASRGKWGVMQ